jgi:hypothetical protein
LVCGDSSAANQVPVALITAPVSATVGTSVMLDGTGSRDPDGHSLTYRWEVVTRPAGSQAALSNASSAKPVFVSDVQGSYSFRLVVNDGKADSSPATVMVTATRANQAPLAKAGEDITAVNGVEVVLNGTGSSDPDGDLIVYRWAFATRPAGSMATLTGANTPRPSFTPDVTGSYVVSLSVSDNTLSSAPAFTTVTSGSANVPPTAVATGPASVVLVGARITLDGSASVDPNGDLMRYSWRWISRPVNSLAVLGFETSARPEFVPDQAGDYVVGLIVSDGRATSAERTVTVRAARTATPTASAGQSQSVVVGSTIVLDGSASGSGDANSSLLSYLWSLVSRPESGAGNAPRIVNEDSIRAQYVPDVAGTYIFRLMVTDSQGNRTSDIVSVRVGQRNAAPIADAGGDRSAMVGTPVVLDGGASRDANGDPLTYAWQLVSSPTTPQASTARLSPSAGGTASTARTVSITPDVPGTYVLALTVNDGTVNSDVSLATITVRAVNQAPKAKILGPSTGVVGSVLTYDSRTSEDDGPAQLLTFQWRLEIKPTNSTLELREPKLPVQAFIPDQPGQYVLRLMADDGALKSAEEVLVITVSPRPTGGTGSGG